jgi:hypothetical protein
MMMFQLMAESQIKNIYATQGFEEGAMKKIISGAGRLFVMLFAFVCVMLMSAQAFSADRSIARLTDFSGTVMIKSQGSWGVEPEEGLPLYSDDKVVTKIGIATVTFNDGAVIEINPNSNLLIQESEEEEGGVGEKIAGLKRQLRLFLGKMSFKTSRSSGIKTSLTTSTMICGLRGTEGILSIGADGQTYLQFTEGGGDTVGDFISGVAADVPAELANLNPVQRAAFVAAAAAEQAKQASEKLAAGEITDADAAYAAAQAAEAAAQEAKAAAEAMLNNPDPEIQSEAAATIAAAEAAIQAAQEAEEQAVKKGATPGAAPTGEAGEIGFAVEEVTDYSKGDLLEDNDRRVADVNAPEVWLIIKPATITNASSAVFEFSVQDDISRTNEVLVSYAFDGGELVSLEPPSAETVAELRGEPYVYSVNFSGLSEDQHQFIVIATDEEDNTATSSYMWTTDYTGPEALFASRPAGHANSSSFGLDATDTNKNLGISYEYSLDGGAWTSTTTALDLALTTGGSKEGSHTISIKATDAAGNTGSAISYTWTYDTIAPVALFASTPEAIDNTSSFDLSATDTNGSAGITYQYSIDGGATWTAADPALTLSLADTTGTDYTIQVKATDAAGNTSPVASYTWTYDTIPPTFGPFSASYDGVGATIDASYTNDEPGTVGYVFDGPNTGLLDGEYTLTVTATDQAGNSSTSDPLTFALHVSSLEGSVFGTGSAITGWGCGGAVAVSDETWGGWEIDMVGDWEGSHTESGSLSLVSGGYSYSYGGYWLSKISGSIDTSTGAAAGISDFTQLTPTSLSKGTGTFTGTFTEIASGIWEGTEIGSGLVNTPLAYSMEIVDTEWAFPEGYQPFYSIYGLMGVSADESVTLMGGHDVNTPLWAIEGYGGAVYDDTDIMTFLDFRSTGNDLIGNAVGMYMRDDGYGGFLNYSGISGTHYPGIGMWYAEGTLTLGPTQNTIPDYGEYCEDNFSGETSIEFANDLFNGGILGNVYCFGEEDWGIMRFATGGYHMVYGEEEGYWLAPGIGTFVSDSFTGYFNLHYLTESAMGSAFREITTPTSDWWADTAYTIEQKEPNFVGYLGEVYGANLLHYGDFVGNGFGLIGVVDNGYGLEYLAMGEYWESYGIGYGEYIWVNNIYGDAERSESEIVAFSGGIWSNGEIDGKLIGILDTGESSAGIVIGDLTGNSYETYYGEGFEGMWMAEGTLEYIEMTKTGTSNESDFGIMHPLGDGYFDAGGSLSRASFEGYGGGFDAESWGIWGMTGRGGYGVATSNDWGMTLTEYTDDDSKWIEVIGNQWSDDEIAGKVAGAWIDIEGATGIIGGELKGTFDPAEWQAAAAGTWLETNMFLDMVQNNQEALEALNIPYIEIGNTNLTGSGGNLTSVNMNDVTFFAYSDGAMPRIWATGDVNGTTTTTIAVDDTATLSGTGFSGVEFTVTGSDGVIGGNWSASVEGSGTVGGYPIDITGGAAGTVDSQNSFSGTGAGVSSRAYVVVP